VRMCGCLRAYVWMFACGVCVCVDVYVPVLLARKYGYMCVQVCMCALI